MISVAAAATAAGAPHTTHNWVEIKSKKTNLRGQRQNVTLVALDAKDLFAVLLNASDHAPKRI